MLRHLYINLRRSRDGTRLFGCLSSLRSVRFGQLVRCAHKRIVNKIIVKLYMERKNMQVQLGLLPFRKKIDLIDVGNFEVGHFRDRCVYEIGPLFCAAQE